MLILDYGFIMMLLKGTGLKDCNCDVYMHTGLITTDKARVGLIGNMFKDNWGTR